MLPRRQWSEMTWQEVHEADTGRWIAVLPLSATEQHGPHLPLGVDRYIAEAYLSPRAAADPGRPAGDGAAVAGDRPVG